MAEGFSNSIIGGAETLIRSAIKSVNYVLGVAGWRISRTGSAEFSDLTARGAITSGNGTVLLNNGGIAVEDATHEYEINVVGGFLARTKPNNNDEAIFLQSLGLYFQLPDPSPGGIDNDIGFIRHGISGAPPAEYPYLEIASPNFASLNDASIVLYGERANDPLPDITSHIDIIADDLAIFVGPTQPSYARGEYGSFLLSFGPATSATVAVTYAKDYTSAPYVSVNIDSGSGTTARWVPRAISRSATGFTFFVFSADAVANTWVNVSLSWVAIEQL